MGNIIVAVISAALAIKSFSASVYYYKKQKYAASIAIAALDALLIATSLWTVLA